MNCGEKGIPKPRVVVRELKTTKSDRCFLSAKFFTPRYASFTPDRDTDREHCGGPRRAAVAYFHCPTPLINVGSQAAAVRCSGAAARRKVDFRFFPKVTGSITD